MCAAFDNDFRLLVQISTADRQKCGAAKSTFTFLGFFFKFSSLEATFSFAAACAHALFVCCFDTHSQHYENIFFLFASLFRVFIHQTLHFSTKHLFAAPSVKSVLARGTRKLNWSSLKKNRIGRSGRENIERWNKRETSSEERKKEEIELSEASRVLKWSFQDEHRMQIKKYGKCQQDRDLFHD